MLLILLMLFREDLFEPMCLVFRSKGLEWRRSQHEDAQSFPEALLDDPYHQDTLPKGSQQNG
jgi:hypothetical protein